MKSGKKKGFLILTITSFCLVGITLTSLYFTNPLYQEKKIAHLLYKDQPVEAIREIKLLLFFHPKNQYGVRMLSLLTSESIKYP